MSEEVHHVVFTEAEIGHLASMDVTPSQAREILAAGIDEQVTLDERRSICLADYGDGSRVYRYHHGEPGGYGYICAREHELRAKLRALV